MQQLRQYPYPGSEPSSSSRVTEQAALNTLIQGTETHVANSESPKKVVCRGVWFILPGNLEKKKREKLLVIGAPRCAKKFKIGTNTK